MAPATVSSLTGKGEPATGPMRQPERASKVWQPGSLVGRDSKRREWGAVPDASGV